MKKIHLVYTAAVLAVLTVGFDARAESPTAEYVGECLYRNATLEENTEWMRVSLLQVDGELKPKDTKVLISFLRAILECDKNAFSKGDEFKKDLGVKWGELYGEYHMDLFIKLISKSDKK